MIIGKSYVGHLEFMKIKTLMDESFCHFLKHFTKLRVPVPNFVGLYPNLNPGKRVHRLQVMIY